MKQGPSSTHTPPLSMGVLTDQEVLLGGIVEGKRFMQARLLPLQAREISGLLEYLWYEGVTSVWVMPTSRFSQQASCLAFQQIGDQWVSLVRPAPGDPDHPAQVLAWPRAQERSSRQRLTLAFPEYAGWDWMLSDPTSLLATVIYLDQVLARPIVDAPALLAGQLLTEATMDLPISSLRFSSVDLFALSGSNGIPIPLREAAAGLAWKRPMTLTEQRQRYLHKYTHVSRELQASLDVPLGVGTPQLSSNGRACDGSRAGLWRVQVERAGSLFDGKQLPGCFEQEWMSTPQVLCCRSIGYEVQVLEGWYWPQSHAVLTRWANTLWQAAEPLHTRPPAYHHSQARMNASRTVRHLAERGLILLDEPAERAGWARPDWRAQVSGRAWALRFAHLARLVKQGTMPILMQGDAFWVISNDPKPLTAVPGLLSARKWSGWTVGYDVPLPLSGAVRDVLKQAASADEVAHQLDQLAEAIVP